MCVFLTLFLLMEMAQAIYHIKAKHRNQRRKETEAKPHGKDDKDITRSEEITEITSYLKFLHFLATEYSTEGAVADPSSSLHKIRHAVSRSVHDGRKRRYRKSKGQRSILVKVLELPVEDPRSLAKFLRHYWYAGHLISLSLGEQQHPRVSQGASVQLAG